MSIIDVESARAAFEASTDFTVGLEEEFALLDPRSLEMVRSKIGDQDPEDYFGFEVRSVGFNPAQEPPDSSHYLPDDLPPGTTSTEWGLAEIPGEESLA